MADSGWGLIFSGVRGWLLKLMDDEAEPRRRWVRKGDSDERRELGETAWRGGATCSAERIRWPVAAILGCTGLPALRFRLMMGFASLGLSAPGSVVLLFVLDKLVSEDENAELMVSSKLCTPNLLSSMSPGDGDLNDVSCDVLSDSLDAFLPRCELRSTSLSLRRKKVVGPEWPGLTDAGALTDGFLPLIVRAS